MAKAIIRAVGSCRGRGKESDPEEGGVKLPWAPGPLLGLCLRNNGGEEMADFTDEK